MSLLQIVILALVQGLAELLPVSSSAHVIVAEKLMHLNPAAPEMTLLLVMLHTGTMFAVVVYFWRAWKKSFFASREVFKQQAVRLAVATLLTAAIGGPIILGFKYGAKIEVETLFGNLLIVAGALAAAGVLILLAGLAQRTTARNRAVGIREAAWMGAVQGLCLPFRGFSRSGATISTGLLLGGIKARVEEFSFALAVIITPPAIAWEAWRLVKARHKAGGMPLTWSSFTPGLLGMCCAFLAGLSGASVAFALAGAGPLAFLRHLLPGGCGGRLRAALLRLLTPPAMPPCKAAKSAHPALLYPAPRRDTLYIPCRQGTPGKSYVCMVENIGPPTCNDGFLRLTPTSTGETPVLHNRAVFMRKINNPRPALKLLLRPRRAAVAVEAAIVMPFVVLLMMGIWEVGRMIEVSRVMQDAVRQGARLAAGGVSQGVPVTCSMVQTEVQNYLTAAGISSTVANGATVTLTTTCSWTDPCNANPLDPFTVTATISGTGYSSLYWVPSHITGVSQLSASVQWMSNNDSTVVVNTQLPY